MALFSCRMSCTRADAVAGAEAVGTSSAGSAGATGSAAGSGIGPSGPFRKNFVWGEGLNWSQ